ncbi:MULTISPECIES: AraC family transcriptional regulator [unclassified Sphingopyxis]|uniref:AraC family transcriptional regulator n=1 Tax=unclassified Sphingopyxis TaxID=2614943 RepID=UPI0007366240|nr:MULTISPECIES: AraC family transcriptional regulator [unclassified Sphingopyxis]KTE38045.1 AraC family transcriptional regulator [Sphingopyxis sp. HIX]KTE84647.1 AraC family transcriptional regulator [Sphingopyxis sp. HXXIV]
MQERLDSLRAHVMRHVDSPYYEAPIPRVVISRMTGPTSGTATLYEPVTCLILQGTKRVVIGDTVITYDASSYFVASLDLPAVGRVVEASPDKPYVAVALRIDRAVLTDLIASMYPDAIGTAPAETDQAGFAVSELTPDLLEAWAGLLRLLDRPDDIAMLAPLREREILYRLLQGPLGHQLCAIAQDDSRLSRVRRAIEWIRAHYDQALRTNALAEIAGMSVASFHRHFKAATAMSPLQYQKTLRLHAARRLLAGGAEASRTAYSVGYESASQFSREYSRAFGTPPSRDAERLRGMAPLGLAV